MKPSVPVINAVVFKYAKVNERPIGYMNQKHCRAKTKGKQPASIAENEST